MNGEKRAYTKRQSADIGIHTRDYSFPQGAGNFVGTLVFKQWIDRGLMAYFHTNSGEKYLLCVWRNRNPKRSYRPSVSELDISYVPYGTQLEVSYEETATGKTRWLTAEIISDVS